jgi:hypothetical protein
MKRRIADPQTCLNIISVMIMLVGLGSAPVIFQTAESEWKEPPGYEMGEGRAYPTMPGDSTAYLQNVQLDGGKAGVLTDGFRRWFAGLWQGEALAYTVAFITTFISFLIFYFANLLPSHFEPPVHRKNN